MQYEALKKEQMQGWHTWNNANVFSYVKMPTGFAIDLSFKMRGRSGMHLLNSLIGRSEQDKAAESVRPIVCAPDGEYTEMELSFMGATLNIKSACVGEDIVLLTTPIILGLRAPVLFVQCSILWGKEGYTRKTDRCIEGVLKDKTIYVYAQGDATFEPDNLCRGSYMALDAGHECGISSGMQRSTEQIKEILRTKREEMHKKERITCTELGRALSTCLSLDTIYDPVKDRVITPVSRIWSVGNGGYILFCWDTYFAALMAAQYDKNLAYSNFIEITNEKTAGGFVPNVASATGFVTQDRSQPPVGSHVAVQIYEKYQEKWFLEKVFDDLYTWNRWFFEKRQVQRGLFAWGSNTYSPIVGNEYETERQGVGGRLGAAYESGLDNSPMYDDIPFDRKTGCLSLIDVGLTSMMLLDCMSLLEIAHIVEDIEKEKRLAEDIAIIERQLHTLWDEKSGLFLNKRTDTGEFSTRISPTNFYALYNKTTTPHQCKKMMEVLYDPNQFWGQWVIPSISRSDVAYKDQSYWRGRIWAPMNYLVYIGLRMHVETLGAAADLAKKSKELILKEWLEHGHIHENYCADTGEGCNKWNSDKFYHWGALLALIAIWQEGGEN